MQTNQVKERFSAIERSIDKAAKMCDSGSNIPANLRTCLQELDQQSDRARQALSSQDDTQIIQCIDKLESLGDRAMHACKQADNVDQELKSAVQEAHDAISQLKHQIH